MRSKRRRGSRAVRAVEEIETGLVLVAPDGAELSGRLVAVAGGEMVLASSRRDLSDAKDRIPAPALVVVDSGLRELAPRRVASELAHQWPSTDCVLLGAADTGPPSSQPAPVAIAESGLSSLAILSRMHAAGVGRRQMEIQLARDFAERFSLPPLAAAICALVLLGVDRDALSGWVGQTPKRFRRYCSEHIYASVGAQRFSDLTSQLTRLYIDRLHQRLFGDDAA